MQVTFKGTPLNVLGKQLSVGDTFGDFSVAKNDLSPLTLNDTSGVRIFLTVPSLDTPTCDTEVRTFNKRAAELSGVSVYAISMDLPFAQSRWCGGAGIDNLTTASDYKDRTFAEATGTYIKELGLLARAIFIVDSDGKVAYVQYCPEIAEEPNYDEALEAAKKVS